MTHQSLTMMTLAAHLSQRTKVRFLESTRVHPIEEHAGAFRVPELQFN